MHNIGLTEAIKAWTSILGSERVLTNGPDLAKLSLATFEVKLKVPAAIYPETSEEVRLCVEIANKCKTPIYTYSSGRNWGFGSGIPVHEGHVIMNLTRMKRILEFNEKLGYVVIEPGVTFQELYAFVSAQKGEKYWIDSTGSSNLSSVIGNTLERGHGQTPYCDHIENIGFMEIVTGEGKIISTGYGAFKSSRNLNVEKWGLGPSIEGLFSQSNLGVVTKMALWLMPAPEASEVIQFGVANTQNFISIFDQLQKLRIRGVLKSGPHYGNLYLTLARIMQYPWEFTKGKTPLNWQDAENFASKKKIFLWNGSVGLYGSRSEVAIAKESVLNVLANRTETVASINNSTMEIVDDMTQDWARDLRFFWGQLTGGPGGTGLPRAYWRKKMIPPQNLNEIDLDADGCGVICVPVCCPSDSQDVVKITDLLHETVLSLGLEPFVALFGTRDRSVHIHCFLIFDKDDSQQMQNAQNCETELNKKFFELGYQPHRLSISQMHLLEQFDSEYLNYLRQLKKVFDPNQILSLGRYLPHLD